MAKFSRNRPTNRDSRLTSVFYALCCLPSIVFNTRNRPESLVRKNITPREVNVFRRNMTEKKATLKLWHKLFKASLKLKMQETDPEQRARSRERGRQSFKNNWLMVGHTEVCFPPHSAAEARCQAYITLGYHFFLHNKAILKVLKIKKFWLLQRRDEIQTSYLPPDESLSCS